MKHDTRGGEVVHCLLVGPRKHSQITYEHFSYSNYLHLDLAFLPSRPMGIRYSGFSRHFSSISLVSFFILFLGMAVELSNKLFSGVKTKKKMMVIQYHYTPELAIQ